MFYREAATSICVAFRASNLTFEFGEFINVIILVFELFLEMILETSGAIFKSIAKS